ncbi:SMC-Scp complex subunit ScpB [Candidatus Uhrbacteria bacterium]|nr:SMC-Scp complex subunit ScpB [Candidatus Uhrbacteria bacterium]MBD3283973.1 SMC-Scp complex subunit ScpB [Candidatus Uhrbacteria bacterium]
MLPSSLIHLRSSLPMSLDQRLEAILFTGAKPYAPNKLAQLLDVDVTQLTAAIEVLRERLQDTGIMLQQSEQEIQLVTQPQFAEDVKKVARDETVGELTRASLEALTILAYRGPLTRPELEQIRGVHSSVILRNLMLRGLVEEREDQRIGQPTFAVTMQFIRHLGLQSLEDLPDYEALRGHENVVDVLKDLEDEQQGDPAAPAGAQPETDRQKPEADLAV